MSKKALVVGAAGGVGTEVVKQLLAAGYAVTGTVLNAAEETHLRSAAPTVEKVLHLDLSDADSVLRELKQTITTVDAVAVCAGISPYAPLEIAPLATLRRTLEINTVSDLAVFQAMMPLLRASKGRILFISSFAGKVGLPFVGQYVASKHALEGMGDVMRREAKPFGVDVILVEPGGIRTPMVVGQREGVGRERAALSPEHAALYGHMYDGFAKLVGANWDTMLEPSVVAATVVDALQTATPQARYQVGEDSKFLCETARKTDVEIDAVMAAFAGG